MFTSPQSLKFLSLIAKDLALNCQIITSRVYIQIKDISLFLSNEIHWEEILMNINFSKFLMIDVLLHET